MTTDPTWISPPASYKHKLPGPQERTGSTLRFRQEPDGSVSAVFRGGPEFQGYEGLLHGGFISTLLDGAMVHGLFARGLEALTTELSVRFLLPVPSVAEVSLRAWHEGERLGVHQLRAELRVHGALSAEATGRFFEVPEGTL